MPQYRRNEHPRFHELTASAVIAQPWSRTFANEQGSQKDDVPRTPTGEVQKQNNFASEVGKKMQKAATGGDEEPSLNRGKEELPKQEGDKKGR